MLYFYGSLQSNNGKEVTRQAHLKNNITATVSTWQHKVHTTLRHINGMDCVRILIENDCGIMREVYFGPLTQLWSDATEDGRSALAKDYLRRQLAGPPNG